MSTPTAATSMEETPVFFHAGEDLLFGMLTTPLTNPRGIAVVMLSGGGTPLSTNVNGLSVRMCRQIATQGFHGFRFDYHGVGESGGTPDRFHLGAPFVTDLEGALAWLRSQGIERVVLVGSCFGARTVLAVASRANGVEGAILISPPVRDFEMGERTSTRIAAEFTLAGYARRALRLATLRGLASKRRRRLYTRLAKEKLRHVKRSRERDDQNGTGRYGVSQRFVDQLDALVNASTPVEIVYGERDDFLSDFERGKSGPLGRALERAGPGIRVTTLPGTVHGYRRMESQEQVLGLVTNWLIRLPTG
jgi:pimeloyl-ACP methyl ester carboxylesterase